MNRNCSHCDGFWMPTAAGMTRCTYCPRGEELRTADHARRNPPAVKVVPAITEEQATVVVAAMGAIPYFPSDATVRGVIAETLRALCATPADATWLADRMIFLYSKWPGPRDLRIVYASRKVPHDGIMPIGISEAYPDGIPPEREPGPAMLALPPGASNTADRVLEAAVVSLAHAKQIPMLRAAPSPTHRVVTQADLDAAMELNQSRKLAAAKKEIA